MGLTDQAAASGRTIEEDGAIVNVADKWEESLGQKGSVIVADTAATTAATGTCFVAFQCLAQSVFAARTAHASAPQTGTFVGVTLAAGTIIYGRYTAFTLTSGTVMAYIGDLP